MKQLLLKSFGGALVAVSALAALPMTAQAGEMAGKSASAIECKSGAAYATRVEWGLPTTDCAAATERQTKAPAGVMGPVRSSEQAQATERSAAQPFHFGAQPTPY